MQDTWLISIVSEPSHDIMGGTVIKKVLSRIHSTSSAPYSRQLALCSWAHLMMELMELMEPKLLPLLCRG